MEMNCSFLIHPSYALQAKAHYLKHEQLYTVHIQDIFIAHDIWLNVSVQTLDLAQVTVRTLAFT